MLKRISCILLLSVSLVVQGLAQVHTASLTGLVVDPQGAAVADTSVKAKNKATNVEQSTKTDASGYYTFASLPVGVYTLTVEFQGFKKAVRDNVDLEVGQKARIDFTLEVGAVTESVLVEAGAPLLSTQEASTGGVVENRLIADLPLAARNWDDLLALVPGVQADRFTEQSGGTANGRTGGANVHGVRSLQNNFVLDGVDNNSISENVQELTTQIVRPSVDSIQEFKVSTNPYSAENGRAPGSLISVTTKSGGNAFHGTLYEFLRNRIFDANDFFSNRSGLKKPQNIQNQFGGNLGGRVIKDRLFFFFNYEGTRIRKGILRLGNVPTANERIGDFSAAAGAANRVTYAPIKDLVGDCRAKAPSAFNADGTFKNNQIPAACIDPMAAKIIGLLPGPNLVPGGALNQFNFVRAPGIIDDTDSYSTRVDWQATSRDSVFVRYTNSDRFRFVPGTFGGILDGTGSSAFGRLSMKGQSAAIAWNRMIGARMVNEFRLGWGRNDSSAVQDSFELETAKQFGFNGVPESPIIGGGLPGLVVQARGGTQQPGGGSGVDRIGSPDFLPKFQKTNQFQWSDTLSIIRGAHQMKVGVDIRGPMRNIYLDVPAMRGSYTFDGNRTGIGLADFLLGYPSNAQLTNIFVVDQRLKMYSGFFQDDWKVTPRLTLNLGLRYDYATWPYEGQDRMTNLDPATGLRFTPANSTVGRSLVKPDKNNFAPRIGLAYQLTSRTVVRAGYGRFYMNFERAGSEDQLALNLPFLVNNSVSAANTASTASNMRLNTGFNLSLVPSAVNPINARLRAINPDSVDGAVDQWNLGIQRELARDMVVTLDYVGTKGTHLSTLRNLNQPFFNDNGTVTNVIGANGQPTPLLPFPSLGPIEFRENNGNSIYHGMEASVEKRFSRGLSFGAGYTLSKSIDQSQEHLASGGTGSFTQNARNILRERRGPSDFDVRHRFGAVSLYELPFGRGRSYLTGGPLSHILGGWRVSGLASTRSGRPFTVRAGGNDSTIGGPRGGGLVSAFADCLRDGSLSGSKRTIDSWFDTTAYTEPKAANPTKNNIVEARLGTCGRNTLRGPRYTNFDFGLARSFDYFGEARRLELRWEVFNIFNIPQFGLPERNISNASKGRISTLAGDPRVMQFALKFVF